MTRYTIDCRNVPSDNDCTVAISGDAQDELLDAALEHAIKVHGHEDTPQFREQLKSGVQIAA